MSPSPVPVAPSAAFDRAIGFVLREEGEGRITADPRDNGGVTRWGVSTRAHPDVDVRALTRDGAIALYRAAYWIPIHGDQLPPALAFALLDTAVLHGVPRAVLLLQRALRVVADGTLGPVTLAAARRAGATAIPELLAWRGIFDARHEDAGTYLHGWLARAFRCAAEALP